MTTLIFADQLDGPRLPDMWDRRWNNGVSNTIWPQIDPWPVYYGVEGGENAANDRTLMPMVRAWDTHATIENPWPHPTAVVDGMSVTINRISCMAWRDQQPIVGAFQFGFEVHIPRIGSPDDVPRDALGSPEGFYWIYPLVIWNNRAICLRSFCGFSRAPAVSPSPRLWPAHQDRYQGWVPDSTPTAANIIEDRSLCTFFPFYGWWGHNDFVVLDWEPGEDPRHVLSTLGDAYRYGEVGAVSGPHCKPLPVGSSISSLESVAYSGWTASKGWSWAQYSTGGPVIEEDELGRPCLVLKVDTQEVNRLGNRHLKSTIAGVHEPMPMSGILPGRYYFEINSHDDNTWIRVHDYQWTEYANTEAFHGRWGDQVSTTSLDDGDAGLDRVWFCYYPVDNSTYRTNVPTVATYNKRNNYTIPQNNGHPLDITYADFYLARGEPSSFLGPVRCFYADVESGASHSDWEARLLNSPTSVPKYRCVQLGQQDTLEYSVRSQTLGTIETFTYQDPNGCVDPNWAARHETYRYWYLSDGAVPEDPNPANPSLPITRGLVPDWAQIVALMVYNVVDKRGRGYRRVRSYADGLTSEASDQLVEHVATGLPLSDEIRNQMNVLLPIYTVQVGDLGGGALSYGGWSREVGIQVDTVDENPADGFATTLRVDRAPSGSDVDELYDSGEGFRFSGEYDGTFDTLFAFGTLPTSDFTITSVKQVTELRVDQTDRTITARPLANVEAQEQEGSVIQDLPVATTEGDAYLQHETIYAVDPVNQAPWTVQRFNNTLFGVRVKVE